MTKSLILFLIIGIILVILGFFLSPFSSVIGVITWILGLIYSEYEKRTQKKRDVTILRGQERIIQMQEKTLHMISEEFTSRRILDRIRRSLKGEISTEELIKRFDRPLNALLIYKWGEPYGKKLIRNRLAELGFKDIASGIKILPPSRMPKPPLRNSKDMEKWLKQNVLDLLPKDHKYSIVFAQLVDLRKLYATKYAPKEWADRFRGYTLFDKLSWEELFPIEYIRKIISRKTRVSVEELIVKHFPFSFLISRFLNDKDLDRILNQRKRVIQDLKNTFQIENLTLLSFAEMDEKKLSSILASLRVRNSNQIAVDMVNEARYWKRFLEKL